MSVRRFAHLAMVAAIAVVASADIGSPNVIFDGNAGPYGVRVIVRPPMVVPGLADIVVRVRSADVSRVVIRPVFWRAGTAGAPSGDVAARVPGDSSTYAGQLWLMSRGAYSVYVTVSGTRGAGTAIVPVMSLATGRLGVSPALAAILIPLGLALLVGLVQIIRAAASDSLVAPGEPADPARRRRGNIITVVAVPVVALLVFGGARWWDAVDKSYERTMYRPPDAVASVRQSAAGPVLTLSTRDTALFHVFVAPIVPDHGKMMHLFLISDDKRTFAHLHPVQADSAVWMIDGQRATSAGSFQTPMPPLSAGRYLLFGDVTMENGATQTVTTTLNAPPPVTGTRSHADGRPDADDAWTVAHTPVPLVAGAADTLGGGVTMSWAGDTPPLTASHGLDLRFIMRDAAGSIVALEPYLGMAGHAVVLRDDGSVFVHLHPMGTVSMAAQRVFVRRDAGDTTSGGRLRPDSAGDAAHEMRLSGDLRFPYEFPHAGRYHIWVQVKHEGRVLTGAFAVEVR